MTNGENTCPFCGTEMEVHTTSEEEAQRFFWLIANEQSFWCPHCKMAFYKKSENEG
jgi:transposase-like protein